MVLGLLAAAGPGQQRQPAATLKAVGGEVTCIGFTSDGETLFSGSLDAYITVWTTKDWKRATTTEPAPPPKAKRGEHQAEFRDLTACATQPTSNRILIASDGDSIATYALPSGKQLDNHRLNANDSALAVNSDDSVVAVRVGSKVLMFGTNDWRDLATFEVVGTVSTLRYAPKGTLLAVAIQRGGIQLWDTQTQHPVRILSRDGNSHQISFGPDGRWLAAGVWGVNKPTDVQVWDVATGLEVTRLKGHKDMVWGAAFSPDGTYLVTGDASGNVILWKVEDWKDCTQLKTSGVYQIAISPDGQWLAAGGGTSEVAVWDLKSLLRSCR